MKRRTTYQMIHQSRSFVIRINVFCAAAVSECVQKFRKSPTLVLPAVVSRLLLLLHSICLCRKAFVRLAASVLISVLQQHLSRRTIRHRCSMCLTIIRKLRLSMWHRQLELLSAKHSDINRALMLRVNCLLLSDDLVLIMYLTHSLLLT